MRPRSTNKRQREGLLNHADDARQSRALARIHVDCPWSSIPSRCATAALARALLRAFTRLGFRTLVMDFAPTAQTVGKDYQVVDTIEGVPALAGELRAAGRFALRVLPDAPSAMRASSSGSRFRPRRGRRATCRSRGAGAAPTVCSAPRRAGARRRPRLGTRRWRR